MRILIAYGKTSATTSANWLYVYAYNALEMKNVNCMTFLTVDLVKLRAKHSENKNESGIICDCSADCKEPDHFLIHVEKK